MIPPELERIGLWSMRQTALALYRLLHVIDSDVAAIMTIVHARCERRTALEQRLLKGS